MKDSGDQNQNLYHDKKGNKMIGQSKQAGKAGDSYAECGNDQVNERFFLVFPCFFNTRHDKCQKRDNDNKKYDNDP